jgi:hypothetical protein
VEVKSPDEILHTLDSDGALDHLPFMPEMLQFCGQRFHVSMRALTVCVSGPGTHRRFKTDDIVTLDGVRCSGVAHDGCQKACMIFWREAWLRKMHDPAVQSTVDLGGSERLRARLKIKNDPKTYFCQASELWKLTDRLSRWEKLRNYVKGYRTGNFNALQVAQSVGIWLFCKLYRMCLGVYPRGRANPTPVESLDLQPAEWVEVKSTESIIETLDQSGKNRGLQFTRDMRALCGKRHRVKGRLDKIIVDGTGEMRQLRNTVCLEGSTCGCAYMGFGMDGCSRSEFVYWREIWLRRSRT